MGMFPNIRAEMARQKITSRELAKKLGMSTSTMSTKLNGKYPFTLDEAKEIKTALKTKLTVEELFEVES